MNPERKFAIVWLFAVAIVVISSAVSFIIGELGWGLIFAFYAVFTLIGLPFLMMEICEWWEIRQMKKRLKERF